MYGTTHAHLVHMCWPLLWGLRQMGRSFATFGTVCYSRTQKFFTVPLDPQYHLCWMKHIGINTKVTSHVFSLLASVEGTTQFALKYPCNTPPPRRETVTCRLSPPPTRETVVR